MMVIFWEFVAALAILAVIITPILVVYYSAKLCFLLFLKFRNWLDQP